MDQRGQGGQVASFLAIAGIVSFCYLVLATWILAVPRDAAFRSDLKDIVVASGASVLAAVAIYASLKRSQAMQKQADVASRSAEAALEGARASHENETANRFHQATQHLGSAQDEEKLGGIYSLGQIASSSDSLYWPAIEVLASLIRKTEKIDDTKIDHREDWQCQVGEQFAPYVSAALTVIGRRRPAPNQNGRLDLSRLELSGAKMEGANLTHVILRESLLERALLDHSDLSDVDARKAVMPDAYLRYAILTRANLGNTKLAKAKLHRAEMRGCGLLAANLNNAELMGANLREANLAHAQFSGADLQGADLSGAVLQEADFEQAKNLTLEQVLAAKSWSVMTKFPRDIESALIEQGQREKAQASLW